jgi:hypothetical protein
MDGNIALLGSDLLTFILFTCVMVGGVAVLTGNAVAKTWRPQWQIYPYGVLLGGAERFFNFALFGGELLSISGFLIDTLVLTGIGMFAYRVTLARQIIVQYPWAYERSGLFSWRAKNA